MIASLTSAARNQVEALTRCALIAQTWRFGSARSSPSPGASM
jgi:hypothetical protein